MSRGKEREAAEDAKTLEERGFRVVDGPMGKRTLYAPDGAWVGEYAGQDPEAVMRLVEDGARRHAGRASVGASGDGFLLVFGGSAVGRLRADTTEEIVALAAAFGRPVPDDLVGPDARAYAKNELLAASYAGETVSREDVPEGLA